MMRFILIVLVVGCSSFFLPLEEGIHISVTKLRSNNGRVLVSLFKDAKGYPDKPEAAFRVAQLNINNKSAATKFLLLPPGKYAIAILHDENNDGKMNTSWIGLPKEGYGFSNNVMGTFGPPAFSKAAVVHNAGSTTNIQIKMRY